MDNKQAIVFFDGVCNFCNSTVDFIFNNKSKHDIYFSSLQSSFASKFLEERGVEKVMLNTIYYFDGYKLYNKSDAVLRIASKLKFPYPILSVFLLVPKILRDALYSFIAKHRYKILGKRETCRIPTNEERSFFLDQIN